MQKRPKVRARLEIDPSEPTLHLRSVAAINKLGLSTMSNNDELAALEETASRVLESPFGQGPSRKTGVLLLRVWQRPSFDAHTSWTLVRSTASADANPKQYQVREVEWDRMKDLQEHGSVLGRLNVRLHRPSPRLTVRDAMAPASLVDPLLERLETLSLPIVTSANVTGIDGTRYGLETYGSLGSFHVQWWASGPKSWVGVRLWAIDAMVILRSVIERFPMEQSQADRV